MTTISGQDRLNVLIVDDEEACQQLIVNTLARIPGVVVTGVCGSGRKALDFVARTPPDLVLLDVEMPEMDGLAVLKILAEHHADVSVLMVSAVRDASRTLQALSLGALDCIPKPETNGSQSLQHDLALGIRVVRARRRRRGWRGADISKKRETRTVSTGVASPPHTLTTEPESHDSLVVIGVSTGGPQALERVIPALPSDLRSAILVVQHMPKGFTTWLARTLDGKSQMNVREAENGESVIPGRVLVAPGGYHMEIERARGAGCATVRLREGPLRNECRPSVDTLFESVAKSYPGRLLSIVMTGMGVDGREGVRRLRERGARSVTQDEESCVIYGMPRAVVEAQLSDEVVVLDRLAARIKSFSEDR